MTTNVKLQAIRRRSSVFLVFLLLLAGPLTGCMFRTLKEQQAQLDQLCLISGTIAGSTTQDVPRVVVLVGMIGDSPRLIDHFVSEGDGTWLMAAQPGLYQLAAFEDRSRDLIYQPGEPLLNRDAARQVQCAAGGRVADIALRIPPDGSQAYGHDVDITHLVARSNDQQFEVSIASVTAAGAMATLDDERFSEERVKAGMWAPFDFLIDAGPGVYFLEPYDAKRIPVLFVHGISGSPRNFRYLIEHLDRTRFQPWVYYYPSGARLPRVADHLTQTLLQLEVRYRVPKVLVVAHSMGGLVSRGFLLRHQKSSAAASPLFVTLSTPWGGHSAAQKGVDYAPTVVRSWYDMAPSSDYLRTLFDDGATVQLQGTEHHLLFSFRKDGSSSESDDGVVTVASQLRPEAQSQAHALYGFNDTHTGILEDPAVSALLNRLLAEAR